jgi:hypothetical protein
MIFFQIVWAMELIAAAFDPYEVSVRKCPEKNRGLPVNDKIFFHNITFLYFAHNLY